MVGGSLPPHFWGNTQAFGSNAVLMALSTTTVKFVTCSNVLGHQGGVAYPLLKCTTVTEFSTLCSLGEAF